MQIERRFHVIVTFPSNVKMNRSAVCEKAIKALSKQARSSSIHNTRPYFVCDFVGFSYGVLNDHFIFQVDVTYDETALTYYDKLRVNKSLECMVMRELDLLMPMDFRGVISATAQRQVTCRLPTHRPIYSIEESELLLEGAAI